MVHNQIQAQWARDRRALDVVHRIWPGDSTLELLGKLAYEDTTPELRKSRSCLSPALSPFMVEALALKGGEKALGILPPSLLIRRRGLHD